MKLLRRIFSMLIILLMLPAAAHAAADNSITAIHLREDTPVPGVQFSLYRITGRQTDPQDAYLHVIQTGQAPVAEKNTDSRGKTAFSGLEDGKYLLVGKAYTDGDLVCELEMSLITVPLKSGSNSPEHRVIVAPKYYLRDQADTTQYRILKIWDDTANTRYRPAYVEFQLYRNGEKHSKVRADSESNWQYTWEDTDPLAVWLVREIKPAYYKPEYAREEDTFVVTNTLNPPGSSGSGKLPQTGQLWWPVPVLAVAGSFLFLTGWLRRKESRDGQ